MVSYFENQGYKVSLYGWMQIGGTAGEVIIIEENEREKDTLLFFYEMLEVIKPQDRDLVKKIIES